MASASCSVPKTRQGQHLATGLPTAPPSANSWPASGCSGNGSMTGMAYAGHPVSREPGPGSDRRSDENSSQDATAAKEPTRQESDQDHLSTITKFPPVGR